MNKQITRFHYFASEHNADVSINGTGNCSGSGNSSGKSCGTTKEPPKENMILNKNKSNKSSNTSIPVKSENEPEIEIQYKSFSTRFPPQCIVFQDQCFQNSTVTVSTTKDNYQTKARKIRIFHLGSPESPDMSSFNGTTTSPVDRLEFHGCIAYERPIFNIIHQLPHLKKVKFFLGERQTLDFIEDKESFELQNHSVTSMTLIVMEHAIRLCVQEFQRQVQNQNQGATIGVTNDKGGRKGSRSCTFSSIMERLIIRVLKKSATLLPNLRKVTLQIPNSIRIHRTVSKVLNNMKHLKKSIVQFSEDGSTIFVSKLPEAIKSTTSATINTTTTSAPDRDNEIIENKPLPCDDIMDKNTNLDNNLDAINVQDQGNNNIIIEAKTAQVKNKGNQSLPFCDSNEKIPATISSEENLICSEMKDEGQQPEGIEIERGIEASLEIPEEEEEVISEREDVIMEIIPYLKDVILEMIPKDVIPENAVPEIMSEDVVPELIPEDVISEMIPEDVIPEMVPEDVVPEMIQESTSSEMILEDIILQLTTKNMIPEKSSEDVIPEMIPKEVISEMIPKEVILDMIPEEESPATDSPSTLNDMGKLLESMLGIGSLRIPPKEESKTSILSSVLSSLSIPNINNNNN